jgi:hypothetical protein
MNTIRAPEFPRIRLQEVDNPNVNPVKGNVGKPTALGKEKPVSGGPQSQISKSEQKVENLEDKVGVEAAKKPDTKSVKLYRPDKITVHQPVILGQNIDIKI